MKWSIRASILSSSPNARKGINLIKACSTLVLERTNGELIRSSNIINCALSPHNLENSCKATMGNIDIEHKLHTWFVKQVHVYMVSKVKTNNAWIKKGLKKINSVDRCECEKKNQIHI